MTKEEAEKEIEDFLKLGSEMDDFVKKIESGEIKPELCDIKKS